MFKPNTYIRSNQTILEEKNLKWTSLVMIKVFLIYTDCWNVRDKVTVILPLKIQSSDKELGHLWVQIQLCSKQIFFFITLKTNRSWT